MSLKFDIVLKGNDKRLKKNQWTLIVIHHTTVGDRKEISQSLWIKLHKNIAKYLARKDNIYVSAHYQIGRYGELTQIIDPDIFVAYHAGKSSYWNSFKRQWLKGCNDFSIGIELLGDGNSIPYSDLQYEKLGELCKDLMERFPTIQPNGIVGHEEISPGRKNDPGKYFNWRKLFYLIYS